MVKGIDDRTGRIEILLDVMGDFNNLSSELTGDPPLYPVIIECIDASIETLKDARERILKFEKEVVSERKPRPHPHSHADSDFRDTE